MATSGTIYGSCKDSKGSATSKYATWIDWKLNSNSITGNYSNITVYVRVQRTDGYNDSAANLAKKPSVTLKVGGVSKTAAIDYINTRNDVVCTFATWTGNVNHADDGTLALDLSCSWTLTGTSSLGSGSISGTATLDTIPRASTISAPNADIGSCSTIVVAQKARSFTHSIAYVFGNLSGYIKADGTISTTEVKMSTTTINFLLPESFYEQIPDSPTGICTLTCRTYDGSTLIDKAQTAQFTVRVPDSSKPVVSGTVVDTNQAISNLTGSPSKLVRGLSIARCTIHAEARNGSTISTVIIGEKTIQVSPSQKVDTYTDIVGINTGNVLFQAIDSRQYPATHPEPVDLVPYKLLTNNARVQRTDPTSGNAILTLEGTCWKGNFGAEDNALTVVYQIDDEEPVTVAVDINDDDTYSMQIMLSGLEYTQIYSVVVTMRDAAMSVPKPLTVQKGIPVFDWSEADFQFHVPVTGDFSGTFQGVHIRTVRLSANDTVTVQSGMTAARQSVFLFGSANGRPVSGLAVLHTDGTGGWDGTEGVTVTGLGGSQFAITVPTKAYDWFTLLSAEPFTIVL